MFNTGTGNDDQMTRHARVIFALIVGLALAGARSAPAVELTGALLYGLRLDGSVGPFWHTASSRDGRPLGFIGWKPQAVRNFALGNNVNGEIDTAPFIVGNYVMHLVWQYQRLDEFPPSMVLNLYFNGDNLTPGISAVVSGAKGLTQARVNTSPSTFSLYLRELDNSGALFFDDSNARVQLGAAFYMSSSGETSQWRPTDLTDIDRVGVRDFKPDGLFDGVLVFELIVGPSQQPPPASGRTVPRAGLVAATPVVPVVPRVGPDQWVVPPTATLPAEPPTPRGGVASSPGRSVKITPSPGAEGESVTPSATADATTAAAATASAAADETSSPRTTRRTTTTPATVSPAITAATRTRAAVSPSRSAKPVITPTAVRSPRLTESW